MKSRRKQQRQIQQWANINVANIFKVLRLLQREEVENTQRYAETISTLQRIAESQRDVITRACLHVANNHAGLLESQIQELSQIRECITELLDSTADAFMNRQPLDEASVEAKSRRLNELIHEFDQNQIVRIQDNSSKTRLTILFYSFMWNSQRIARQTLLLLHVFQEPLAPRLLNEGIAGLLGKRFRLPIEALMNKSHSIRRQGPKRQSTSHSHRSTWSRVTLHWF